MSIKKKFYGPMLSSTLASLLFLVVHVSWTTHNPRTHSKQRTEIERPVDTVEPHDPENPSETCIIGTRRSVSDRTTSQPLSSRV